MNLAGDIISILFSTIKPNSNCVLYHGSHLRAFEKIVAFEYNY